MVLQKAQYVCFISSMSIVLIKCVHSVNVLYLFLECFVVCLARDEGLEPKRVSVSGDTGRISVTAFGCTQGLCLPFTLCPSEL